MKQPARVAIVAAVVCGLVLAGAAQPAMSPAGWLHTDSNLIKDGAGNPVMLRGVVMYVCKQNEQAKFTAAKTLGANMVRLAFWKNAIDGTPTAPCAGNGLAALDQAIGYAKAAGLMVILDEHVWSLNVENAPSAFFTSPSLQAEWLALWTTLINHYASEPTVIGIDLMNEPWAIAGKPANAQSLWETIARNAEIQLHPLNPNLLIFISGWGPVTQPMWGDVAFLQRPNVIIKDHVYGQKTASYLSTRYNPYLSAGVPVWLGEIGFSPSDSGWIESQLDNFDALALHYTLFVYGVSSWNLSWDIVNSTYGLTGIGVIYRDHLAALVPTATPTATSTHTPTFTPTATATSTPMPTRTPDCQAVVFSDGTVLDVCKR